MVAALIERVVTVVAPRAVATMVGGGMLAGFGSQVIDLRGQLPVGDAVYSQRPLSKVEGVVWHHSATKGASIRSIAQYHVEVRKWPAIAYHYAIGWDGVVYVLHDPTTISYQSQGYNSRTIGVVLIGNYQDNRMSAEMQDAALRLQDHLREKYDLKFAWLHGDTKPTLCPGRWAEQVLRPSCYGPRPPGR